MAGPDTNTDAPPTPIWGFGPPSAEPDTKKLDALLASLNGSAERFQALWFSFLGLTLYLAIAALATTHRNLLLGEPQVLPILNIKVELLPFYVIAPLLYLVFHFYLLMMLALLARTAAEFEDELRKTLKDSATQERYRARIENALFLQLLVGMKDERVGLNSFLLRAIAFLTLMLAPISTLILMQMMFLPYHSLPITWWHRVVVVADAGMTLFLWYRLVYLHEVAGPPLLFLDRSRQLITSALLASLVVVTFAFWLSFWDGRWAGEPWIGRQDLASTQNGVVFGLFRDRLELANETIVGKEKLDKTKEEIASRGGAFASRDGNFVPTINFDRRDLQAADLSGADLRGVSLTSTMQGADLSFARLDGARLFAADLQGANLSGARLQGADLRNAQLRGANLTQAELQAADLWGAQLQGANLFDAELQVGNLVSAQLQGANLTQAWLQGAELRYAQLQGANLTHARLQGADLRNAQLQGAHLSNADLADSDFSQALVFRADIASAHLATAAVQSVRADPVVGDSWERSIQLDVVDAWVAQATQFARSNEKDEIVRRFAWLKAAADQPGPKGVTWTGMEEASRTLDPDGGQHRRRLADRLGDLACGPLAAPYIARALMYRHLGDEARLEGLGDQLNRVQKRMEEARRNPEMCKGTVGFTEKDWRTLDAIKPTEPARTNP